MIKQKLIPTEYPNYIHFHGMKEERLFQFQLWFDIRLATKIKMYYYIVNMCGVMCYETCTKTATLYKATRQKEPQALLC